MLKGRNLINVDDFSIKEVLEIIELGKKIFEVPSDFSDLCDGKLLGTLFFEPSTRTRLSFEAAILRLGGRYINVAQSESASTAKGESLVDTVKTVASYVDIIAMRHPKEGSAIVAGSQCSVPLINCGDGGHQHPTQTLTDLLTIYKTKSRLEDMTIGLCGDLKFGRTVHSLVKMISKFKNNKFIFISPKELVIPEYLKVDLEDRKIEFIEEENLENIIDKLDILYMTRVQKERFFNEADYVRLRDSYILTMQKLSKAKEDLCILHPLPRINEISIEVDNDKRAKYFKQVELGMYIRMALILKLLGVR